MNESQGQEAWLCTKLMSLWKRNGFDFDELLIAVRSIRDVPGDGIRENMRDIFNDLTPPSK